MTSNDKSQPVSDRSASAANGAEIGRPTLDCEQEALVTFRPSGREAYVLPGTHLVEAAAEAGLVIETPCGGEGLCGRCRVVVAAGAAAPTPAELHWLADEELREGSRLACQSTVLRTTEVEIPPRLAGGGPNTRYLSASMPLGKPTIRRCESVTSSFRRPAAATTRRTCCDWKGRWSWRRWMPNYRCWANCQSGCATTAFTGTAVLAGKRLLDFEAGNTEADAFAVAFDIGTTTLVATLHDLGTGSEWAVAARLNPQTRFGDDVLSRILYARQGCRLAAAVAGEHYASGQ